MLTILVIAAIALVAGILAYAATRPDAFQLTRSITIDAPPEKIFPLINDLRSFNIWNPFLKKDPAAKLAYSGPESGTGAAHAWQGNGRVGAGRIEITDSVPPSKIAMKLDMITPMEAHNQVVFALKPAGTHAGNGEVVTWTMSGRSPYVAKLMGLVCNMDKMVGAEFDKGLADLKTLAER